MKNFAERLKLLRQENDITQDRLAEYLGLSYQAVSKWENNQSYPDITLIPAIANFFGCSADYLLGIEPQKNDEKIKEYLDKAMICSHSGEMEKGIEIVREALSLYPNNDKLLSVLVDFLFGKFCFNGDKELLKEVITKGELVLQDSKYDEYRIDVIEKLAYTYNILEMQDKAIETANRLPNSVVNRPMVLSNIIMPMDKRKEIKQECVYANLECMINQILWLGGITLGRKQYEKSIDIYNRAIAVIENIGNEGLFLLKTAGAYNGLAMAHSSLGETDKAYHYIDKTIENYMEFEKLMKDERTPYNSPMFDMLYFDLNNLHRNSTTSEFEDWYSKMRNDYKNYFDSVIKDDRFDALCEKIERCLKEIK